MATPTVTCRCGAAVPEAAAWCPRCLDPMPGQRTAATPTTAGPPDSAVASAMFAADGPGRLEPPLRLTQPTGRFAKTEVSFGLTGRIVVTIMLLIPAVWFAFLAKELFSIGGLVLYVGVVLPWAMRDLWRHPRRNI